MPADVVIVSFLPTLHVFCVLLPLQLPGGLRDNLWKDDAPEGLWKVNYFQNGGVYPGQSIRSGDCTAL